jgi:hypothetical protein
VSELEDGTYEYVVPAPPGWYVVSPIMDGELQIVDWWEEPIIGFVVRTKDNRDCDPKWRRQQRGDAD